MGIAFKKIADTVCLSCHSGNRVGADYHGFFERDYYYQYQQPFGSRPWFGAFQHHLVKDVHQQAGLQCVDCHKEHVEQSRMPRFEGEQPSVRCQDCHGGFNEKPSPNAAKGPVFNSASVAHQSFHQKSVVQPAMLSGCFKTMVCIFSWINRPITKCGRITCGRAMGK